MARKTTSRQRTRQDPKVPEVEATKPAAPAAARSANPFANIPIQGIGAIVGAAVFVLLNVVTDGKVPGGYSAGVIGGTIGWVIGIGVEKLIASRRR
jgi:hypothetical protein